MRGQWADYDSFNLVELIDELKARIELPFRADDTLHGAMIVGRDYHGTCKELRKWLENDDKKAVDDIRNANSTTYSDRDEEPFHIGTRIVGQSNNDDRIDWQQYLDELIDDE